MPNLGDLILKMLILMMRILDGASLVNVFFDGVSILRANLSNTIIINPSNYDKMILDIDTVFHDSIIDDPQLLKHISNYTSYIPKQKLENKSQLREKLEQSNIVEWKIDVYVGYSRLPY